VQIGGENIEPISSPVNVSAFLTRTQFDAVESFDVVLVVQCGAIIGITNMLPVYASAKISNASTNGMTIQLIYQDQTSQFFETRRCKYKPIDRWSRTITGLRQFVDVIAF
jgi:hypothetical protein